jgi:hypothetical protein
VALTTYWESEIILTGQGRACWNARTAKISACCVVAPAIAMFIIIFLILFIFYYCAGRGYIVTFLLIYSHVHTLFGSFLHPAPLPHTSPPSGSGRSHTALVTILLKKRNKHNKKDKAF